MVELEKKLLLSKDEYDFLLRNYGLHKSIIKQINYYFDTDDLCMNKKGITCRIRLKDGKYNGTMKSHSPGMEKSIESNIEVRNGIADNGFIDMDLKYQGELITERCIVYKDPFCEVVLDKNIYLEHTDYELEIEYSDKYEEYAESILQNMIKALTENIALFSLDDINRRRTNSFSKSNRFFERRSRCDFNT